MLVCDTYTKNNRVMFNKNFQNSKPHIDAHYSKYDSNDVILALEECFL